MVQVRTDFAALVTGAIIFGVFTVACAALGFYVFDRTVLTSDDRALWAIKMGLGYAGLFLLAHLALRKAGIYSQGVYAVAGAVVAVVAFLISADRMATVQMIQSGSFAASLLIPAALGWLVGFIYHFRAGYVTDRDDPHALHAVLNPASQAEPSALSRGGSAGSGNVEHSNTQNSEAGFVTPDGAHAGVNGLEYFSGPLRVRTSPAAIFVAAFLGVLIWYVGITLFVGSIHFAGSNPFSPFQMLRGVPGPDVLLPFTGLKDIGLQGSIAAVVIVVVGMVLHALAYSIPVSGLVYLGHLAVRWRKRTDYGAYIIAGLIVPPLVGLLCFIIFVVVGLIFSLPCATAMVIYRKLAGLEPTPVHEDIQVSDRRFLVGADHARRRYGRIIIKPSTEITQRISSTGSSG